VAKFLAHLLATAALWVLIQTSLKIPNGRHKQRSGQHILARQRIHKNVICTSLSLSSYNKINNWLELGAVRNVEVSSPTPHTVFFHTRSLNSPKFPECSFRLTNRI